MAQTKAVGREAVLERFERDLMAGTTFHYKAESNRSADRLNYQGPMREAAYGEVLATLGRFARQGRWQAYVAREAVQKVNLYGNDYQVAAALAEAFGKVVREGFYDVVAATGPEPGRPSSHQHPTTLRQALLLEVVYAELTCHLWLGSVPGYGWAVAALLDEAGVTVHDAEFPALAREKAKREFRKTNPYGTFRG
jgi:hypothetical protein